MKIDKYTKFVLTLIAFGIILINFQMLNKPLIKTAKANPDSAQIVVIPAPENTRVKIITNDGKFVCKFKQSKIKDDKWTPTGC
tara:strand:- start:75 stop:323 length:249 start_codon:yes stop_codon:yes gene_type:complete